MADVLSETAGYLGRVVLVVDGPGQISTSLQHALEGLSKKVQLLQLGENHGQHRSLQIGLELVAERGNAAIVLDCDGQDNPREIGALLDASNGLKEPVVGRRVLDSASPLDSITSRIFGSALRLLAGKSPDSRLSSFSFVPSLEIKKLAREMRGDVHYLHALLKICGNDYRIHNYSREDRKSGSSSYSFLRRTEHALRGVVGWSTVPLMRIIALSGLSMLVAFVLSVSLILLRFFGSPPQGWVALVLLNLTSTSLILLALGVVGLYVERILRLLETLSKEEP